MRNGLILVLVLIIFIGGYVWYDVSARENGLIRPLGANNGSWDIQPFVNVEKFVVGLIIPPEKPISNVIFDCDDKKNFQALFYSSTVHLHLSDGRDFILPLVASSSTTSTTVYAAPDNSVTFIERNGKGLIEEGSSQMQTYQNCAPLSNNYS